MISYLLRSVLVIVVACAFFSFSEDSSLVQSKNKIAELELEIKNTKSQVENLDKANDKILQVTYFTVGSMFALIAGLAIWNAIANYKINTSKMQEAVGKMRIEQQEAVKDYFEKTVPAKIDSKLSGIDSKYNSLEQAIISTQIELKKMQVVSSDLTPGANLETWTLIELLDLAYKKYKIEFAPSDYEVIGALEAIIVYVKKYKSLPNYEVDRLLAAIKKIEEDNFARYVDEIRKNLLELKWEVFRHLLLFCVV